MMPKAPLIRNETRTVSCANCHREQPDQGRSSTCIHCGCSPLPSYAYTRDNGFYPQALRKSLEEMVAERRGRRKAQ